METSRTLTTIVPPIFVDEAEPVKETNGVEGDGTMIYLFILSTFYLLLEGIRLTESITWATPFCRIWFD